MTTFFILVFGLYFLFLMVLGFGFRKTQTRSGNSGKNIFISVVVAMRNEEGNLPNLLQSISMQNLPVDRFEIILVDDHSEDNSVTEAKRWLTKLPNLRIISLEENEIGKKAALTRAIQLAKGDLIATTDADCIVPPAWLTKINESFDLKTNMLIGAVTLREEGSFWGNLQSIEFASVMGTGISMASLGKPVMCNGANLAFRKDVFDEVEGYSGNEHIASGDDEFLMRKIALKYPGSITVLTEAVVVTKPQDSVSSFIKQRMRWAGKWKLNSSLLARSMAVLIFLVQLSWLTLVVWTFRDRSVELISVLIVKVLIDFFFLLGVCRFLKMKFNSIAFVALQFLYPVYVLYVGLFSQLKNHQWKGRRI